MASATKAPSSRVKHFWQKMFDWYGARFGEQYGPIPSPDWCVVIDGTSNEAMKRALAEIKARHAVHPPTLPEFDAICSRLSRSESAGPSMAERLSDHVLKHRTLTGAQMRGPWTYRATSDGQMFALDVPADGDTPGFRVRADDLSVEHA